MLELRVGVLQNFRDHIDGEIEGLQVIHDLPAKVS